MCFGGNGKDTAGSNVAKLISKYGFFRLPEGFGIVIAAENVNHSAVSEYRRELEIAEKAGFTVEEEPPVSFSHAAVLRKADLVKGIDD